jgi:hypothetical protein
MRLLSLDEEVKRGMLDRAECMVRGRYDWDRIAKDMETMFKELSS